MSNGVKDSQRMPVVFRTVRHRMSEENRTFANSSSTALLPTFVGSLFSALFRRTASSNPVARK